MGQALPAAPAAPQTARRPWRFLHTILLLATFAGIWLVGLFVPGRLWAWVGILILGFLMMIVIGLGISGCAWGIFIDERNLMSLARFQAVIWTVFVLSAFVAAALWNISVGQPDALAIAIPSQLWVLMGIGMTSLVGTPLILQQQKKAQPAGGGQGTQGAPATPLALANRLARGGGAARINTIGLLVVNNSRQDASLADLFEGEQVGNVGEIDLGKVQMFYVTLILVVTYTLALVAFFGSSSGKIGSLPPLNDGIVALLGVSHATYLANKSVPHAQ
jgi:hypothetical protein